MSRWGREKPASPSSPESVEAVRQLRSSLQKHFEMAMNRIETYQKQSNAQQRETPRFRVMHSGMYITGMRDVNLELSCSQLDGGSPYRFRSVGEDEDDKGRWQDREQETPKHGSPLGKLERSWDEGQDAKQPLRASAMEEKELESAGSDETEKEESPIKYGRINWPKFNDDVEKMLEEQDKADDSLGAEAPLPKVEKDKETDSFEIQGSVEELDDVQLGERKRVAQAEEEVASCDKGKHVSDSEESADKVKQAGKVDEENVQQEPEPPIKFGRINWPKFDDEVEKLLEEKERANGNDSVPKVEKDKETDSFEIQGSVEEEEMRDVELDERKRKVEAQEEEEVVVSSDEGKHISGSEESADKDEQTGKFDEDSHSAEEKVQQEPESPIKFGRINWPKTSEFKDEVEKKVEEEDVTSGNDSIDAEAPLPKAEKDKETDSFDIQGSVEEEEPSDVQLDERKSNAQAEEEEPSDVQLDERKRNVEAEEEVVSSDEGKHISDSEESANKDEQTDLHSADEKEPESPPPVVDLTSDGEFSDVFPEITIDSACEEEEDISETVFPEIHICDDIELPTCEGELSPESSSHKDAVEELEAAIKSGESGRQKRAAEELANDTYLDEFDAFLSKIENEPLTKTNPQPVAEEYQSPILNKTSDFSSASEHEEERTELGVDLGSSDSVDDKPREEQHATSFYGNDNGVKLSDEETPVVDQVMEISSSDSVTDLIQPTSVSPSSTLRAGAINASESQGSVVLEAQEECLSQLATIDDDLNFVLLNEEEQNEQD